MLQCITPLYSTYSICTLYIPSTVWNRTLMSAAVRKGILCIITALDHILRVELRAQSTF